MTLGSCFRRNDEGAVFKVTASFFTSSRAERACPAKDPGSFFHLEIVCLLEQDPG